jgi:hypothetical protein
VLAAAIACGGENGGSSPAPSPSPSPQNPCAAVSLDERLESDRAAGRTKIRGFDGSPQWRVLEALWIHRQARDRRSGVTRTGSPAVTTVDVGDIAVLRDEGELVLPPNAFDVKGVGLRFTRNAAGGYDVRHGDAAFRTTLGNRLTLSDDDTTRVDVPFAFPFYAGTGRSAFVNSDGNVTFGEGDNASTDRNIARLLTGPPRVALFLADLDPSTGGGVFAHAAADQYTVTWCGVRGFESSDTVTAQVTLLPDGAIEMKYASAITLTDAVVGASPGRTGDFAPVNLSAPGPTAGGGGAVGERFAESPALDTVALAQAFYRSHPDSFDQLVIWTDTRVTTNDTFAFETTVANAIEGIGQEIFDASGNFGSAGRLQSYAIMDDLAKYPADPATRFLGENSTLSVLAHEVGHRWLAYLEFRDHTGQQSDALLGRQRAHWSFFFDSDASVMEGNDIEALGGGSFRTAAAVRRYSRLDQYAMGLLPAGDVPPFFYVADPVNLSEERDRESAPDVGVTFNGTRRDVLIDDVIAIHGPRVPGAAASPRIHRQAFVYVVSPGRPVDAAQVAKVDRIRREFEEFFRTATDGRMRAETRLGQ